MPSPAEPTPALLPSIVEPSAPEVIRLTAPVDVRNGALVLLTSLAVLYGLHIAAVVFVPLFLGLIVSYALSPLVDRLHRLRIPRAVAGAALLVTIIAAFGWGLLRLSSDAVALVESLPGVAERLRGTLVEFRGGNESAIDKVQRAAVQLELAAQEGTKALPPLARGVSRVSIEPARFDIKNYMLVGTMGAFAWVGQTVIVVLIAFFLMCSGNQFRRKLVRMAGPSFAQKRITVQVLDQITGQIHRFLQIQLLTCTVVGIATGLMFWSLGLNHAAVWGVASAVFSLVPYLGAMALVGGSALVGFVQFGSLEQTLLVAGAATVIHVLARSLLSTWLTSRSLRLNNVAVFVGVLAFGWLWGAWGLLLGVPILTTIKTVCDHVEDFKNLGDMLGD